MDANLKVRKLLAAAPAHRKACIWRRAGGQARGAAVFGGILLHFAAFCSLLRPAWGGTAHQLVPE